MVPTSQGGLSCQQKRVLITLNLNLRIIRNQTVLRVFRKAEKTAVTQSVRTRLGLGTEGWPLQVQHRPVTSVDWKLERCQFSQGALEKGTKPLNARGIFPHQLHVSGSCVCVCVYILSHQ